MSWTERDLRDAWARWTEARPDGLDWKVRMQIRMGDDAVLDVPLVGQRAEVRVVHVCEVELLGPPKLWGVVDRSEPGSSERPVLASWTVAPAQALVVMDALTELFSEPLTCDRLERDESGARAGVELWLWERLHTWRLAR